MRIKDERLKIRLLKNIRIAFIFQTVGIVTILAVTMIQEGTDAAFSSPLFLVLNITVMILLFLQVGVSQDVYEMKKGRKKKRVPYYVRFLTALGAGIAAGLIVFFLCLYFDPQKTGLAWVTALVFGLCMFASCLVVYTIVWYRDKKHEDDDGQ